MSNIKENLQPGYVQSKSTEAAPHIELLAPKRGLGLIVVHEETGMIFVNRERQSKPATGRFSDSLSIPLETAKRDEDFLGNFYGAFAELIHDGPDQTVSHVQEHFSYATEHAFYPDAVMTAIDTTPIECSVGIVVYNGPSELLVGHHHEEVTPYGWIDPVSFINHPERRALAAEVVQFALNAQLLEANRQATQKALIFDANFSIGEHFNARELLEDS